MPFRPLVAALLLGLCLLPGCSYLTPYKLDIPQGNAVTEDQIARLKPGMTQTQVRQILGTPLLNDLFHQSRWDYLYFESKAGRVEHAKRFHVLFDGDRVVGFGGDALPAKARVADLAPDDPRADAKAAQKQRGAP